MAEFLGIERLILAIKIRWYINIGRGQFFEGDEQDERIAEAFDKEYGGISKAISTGLFPYFCKQDDINCEKNLVVVSTHNFSSRLIMYPDAIQITEATKPLVSVQGREDFSPILDAGRGGIVGALNWLQQNGYTTYEEQMSRTHDWGEQATFSRRKHNAMTCNAIEIFVPSEDEEQPNPNKQFALLLEDTDEDEHVIIAPAQFSEIPSVREAEFGCKVIRPPRDDDNRCLVGWLERNGFITHEKTYDEIFSCCIKRFVLSYYPEDNGKQKGRLYSRNIQDTT